MAAMENMFVMSKRPELISVLATVDWDDRSMRERAVLESAGKYIRSGFLTIRYGNSRNKIEAINRDMDIASKLFPDWGIIVNMSDDMEWVRKGWDDVIRDAFATDFPDLNGGIHFNDGFTGPKLCTMSIMGRPLYEDYGYIYHPSYESLFCDDEYTITAKASGRLSYHNEVIYTHNHPNNVGGEMDALLIATESKYSTDKVNFEKRKAEGFPNGQGV